MPNVQKHNFTFAFMNTKLLLKLMNIYMCEVWNIKCFVIIIGEKRVSGEAAVKFAKLAFNYEEWDVFDSTIVFVTNFLQVTMMLFRHSFCSLFLWGRGTILILQNLRQISIDCFCQLGSEWPKMEEGRSGT